MTFSFVTLAGFSEMDKDKIEAFYFKEIQGLEIHLLHFSFMWVSSEQYAEKSCIPRWRLRSQHKLRLQYFDSVW